MSEIQLKILVLAFGCWLLAFGKWAEQRILALAFGLWQLASGPSGRIKWSFAPYFSKELRMIGKVAHNAEENSYYPRFLVFLINFNTE
jgi:hypothetical protein